MPWIMLANFVTTTKYIPHFGAIKYWHRLLSLAHDVFEIGVYRARQKK